MVFVMTRPWHLAHLLTTVFYFVYISHILVFCSINLSSMFGHVTVNHPEVEWMNLPWTCFIIWQPFGKWITEANNSLNTQNVCFVFQRLSVSCQNVSSVQCHILRYWQPDKCGMIWLELLNVFSHDWGGMFWMFYHHSWSCLVHIHIYHQLKVRKHQNLLGLNNKKMLYNWKKLAGWKEVDWKWAINSH